MTEPVTGLVTLVLSFVKLHRYQKQQERERERKDELAKWHADVLRQLRETGK